MFKATKKQKPGRLPPPGFCFAVFVQVVMKTPLLPQKRFPDTIIIA
jgi:hypothetical protein